MSHPPDHEARDAADSTKIRVLEAGHKVLTDQMAELVIGMQAVHQALQRGDSRMGDLEAELKANSDTTAEIRDILAAVKTGIKVLGGIGTMARWAGYLAGAGAAVYTAWHMLTHGGRPPGAG